MLASMTVQQDRINNLFHDAAYSVVGKYSANLYSMGEFRKTILVDGIPLTTPLALLAASDEGKLDILDPLLKKGYDQFQIDCGSESGDDMARILFALTGMPVRRFTSSKLSTDELYDLFTEGA